MGADVRFGAFSRREGKTLVVALFLAACSSGGGTEGDGHGGEGGDSGAGAGGATNAGGGAGGERTMDVPEGGAGGDGAGGTASTGGAGQGGAQQGGAAPDASVSMPDAGTADAMQTQAAQAERVWLNRTIEWKAGAQPDLAEPNVVASWVKPVNYIPGSVEMRIVTETVGTMPAFWELCVVDRRGADHFVCFRCPNAGISAPGQQTCSLKPMKCTGYPPDEPGTCYGGNYRFFEAPSRTWHRLRSEITTPSNGSPNLTCRGGDPTCGAPGRLEAASLPFKAKATVVLVPGGQTFKGWDAYSLP